MSDDEGDWEDIYDNDIGEGEGEGAAGEGEDEGNIDKGNMGEVVVVKYRRSTRLTTQPQRLSDEYNLSTERRSSRKNKASSRRNKVVNKGRKGAKTARMTQSVIARNKSKKLTLVPGEDEDADEDADEECNDKSCAPSGSCSSTNYLELVLAIQTCFGPETYAECAQFVGEIQESAAKINPNTKYIY